MSLNTGFTTYQFAVEVITPVHVGMAQEKHYLAGLDFLQEGNTLTFLNVNALFKALAGTGDLATVTADMAAGKFEELNDYLLNKPVIREPDVQLRQETIDTLKRNIREIRRAYMTGLGQPVLPGTSLKGAIRSVLLRHLTRHNIERADNWGKMDEALFGPITANLMRYVQLSDVAFDRQDLKVYPMKVFSGDGNPQLPDNTEGKWKHSNPGGHDPAFMPSYIETNRNAGFINFYESLKPTQSKSQLRISIANALQGPWLNFARAVPNYVKSVETLTGDTFINLIRQHTAQYIEKERAYYSKFKNEDLGDMETRIAELERHNNSSNSCLLRVGANVGFHSITGDWQDISQKHYEAWVKGNYVKLNGYSPMFYKERQRTTDHIFAKTRKFSLAPTGREYDFLLPGFIKLTLQPTEERKNDSRQHTRQRMTAFRHSFQEKEDAKLAAIEAEKQRIEAERQPAYLGRKAKKGDIIDAVVTKTGKRPELKLYIIESETATVDIGYPNIPVGTVVQVLVKNIAGKDKVDAVEFKRVKGK